MSKKPIPRITMEVIDLQPVMRRVPLGEDGTVTFERYYPETIREYIAENGVRINLHAIISQSAKMFDFCYVQYKDNAPSHLSTANSSYIEGSYREKFFDPSSYEEAREASLIRAQKQLDNAREHYENMQKKLSLTEQLWNNESFCQRVRERFQQAEHLLEENPPLTTAQLRKKQAEEKKATKARREARMSAHDLRGR